MKIKLLILTTVIILLSIGCSKNVVETVEIIEPQYKQYPALPESKPTQIAMRSFINGDFAASQGDFVNGLRVLRVAANQDTMSFMIKKRILDTMLAKAQSDPGIIPEAVTYAEDMYSKNLYDNDVLISMAQAYLLNNQPEDALRIYNLKLEYKPEGQDYLRIFVIKAKYLKDMSISDLDKAYEFSNNNPRLIMTIANLRAQFDPEGTIIMLNDAISTNFESQLLDLLINLLEKKGAEDSIVKVLSENISNLSEFQKGILIEVHYNKENFPEIIKHFDYYYDTNELQIQKYLFFACIGKDHLLLLDKIYARLVNNPDIEAEDVEILSLMAAESCWLDRNPEKTAEYLCKIDEFSFIHDFFIKRFVSKFSVEEKTTLEYLVRILSENGLDQSLEDFLIARNYYLNDNHEMALEYAKKVDPKVLVKHHIVSALALIALQSGDDVEWAKKLFDMSSDEETISVND
ncbi:MAG: hypothetical protein P9L91_09570, partial [Candidatus Zophobacter franzmannii]|nr:hypothetical protein [Candidatus Zophobacter franzmannii]